MWTSKFRLSTFDEQLELIEGLHKTIKIKNSDGTVKNISFLIEIKQPEHHRINGKPYLSKILIDLLDKHGLNRKDSPIILQSFDPYELMHIKFELKSPLRLVQLMLNTGYFKQNGRNELLYWYSEEGLRNISSYAVGK